MAGCRAQPPLTRVGGVTWIGYEPMFLARELGLLDAASLRLVEMPSSSTSLMALATGDIEAAMLTLDECLLAQEGGLDIRVILVFDYSAGADVVMSRPGIDRLADLRGRRIGVEDTAVGALMLAKVLDAAGIGPEAVIKVRTTLDRQLRAYQAGEVDVVVSFEPVASQLQAAGAQRLYDSTAFPGLIVDVLAARTEALDRAPEAFRQLLVGHFQALDFVRASPDEAFVRMAPRLGMAPEAMRAALGGVHLVSLRDNRAWLDGPTPGLLGSAREVGRVMLDTGLLRRMTPFDRLADPRFLPGAP